MEEINKKKLTFKYLPKLTIAMNKLYNVPKIPKLSKLKILKLIRKLREDEKVFEKIKMDILNEECRKDEKGNFITKTENVNGLNLEKYDIPDQESWNNKINPILEQVIEFDPEMINIPLIDICETPLTVNDIDLLLEFGILKEDEEDAGGKQKIITTKH